MKLIRGKCLFMGLMYLSFNKVECKGVCRANRTKKVSVIFIVHTCMLINANHL